MTTQRLYCSLAVWLLVSDTEAFQNFQAQAYERCHFTWFPLRNCHAVNKKITPKTDFETNHFERKIFTILSLISLRVLKRMKCFVTEYFIFSQPMESFDSWTLAAKMIYLKTGFLCNFRHSASCFVQKASIFENRKVGELKSREINSFVNFTVILLNHLPYDKSNYLKCTE